MKRLPASCSIAKQVASSKGGVHPRTPANGCQTSRASFCMWARAACIVASPGDVVRQQKARMPDCTPACAFSKNVMSNRK
eukprot:12964269-Alexandrium_andersonii.AAC.1